MTWRRGVAAAVLGTTFAAVIASGFLLPHGYEEQSREHPGEGPSATYPLGTDDLGRDRLARLAAGARVSLLLAPVAAALSTLVAVAVGVASGFAGPWGAGAARVATNLFLSLPWLFLLLAVRALLPLNAGPWPSVAVTFLLLGGLGWAPAARVVHGAVAAARQSGFLLQARAAGCSPWRLFRVHMLAALRPVAVSQFLLLTPVFILSEANLSLLGLGVTEPLPSLGNLIRELENYPTVVANPWMAAPAVLLAVVLAAFQLLMREEEVPQ